MDIIKKKSILSNNFFSVVIMSIWLFLVLFTKIVNWFGIQQVLDNSSDNIISTRVWSNELSIELINSHIKFWNHNMDFNENWSTILWTIKNLKYLLTLNVAQEMDMTENKEKYLNDYLNNIAETLHIANQKIDELDTKISEFDSKMQVCLTQKESSDSDFFYSLEINDDLRMQDAVKSSIENWKCIWENRVEVNYRKVLLSTTSYYNTLLQKKYNYIFPKKDIIITHFDLMKDSLLEELFWTRDALLKNYE